MSVCAVGQDRGRGRVLSCKDRNEPTDGLRIKERESADRLFWCAKGEC